MSVALVGSPAARRVHGFSADADVALLGASSEADEELIEALTAIGTRPPVHVSGLGELGALAAARDDVPLVVASAALRIAEPALLDLLDRPGTSTAALLADPYSVEMPQQIDGIEAAALVRVGRDGAAIESAGSAVHSVLRPNRVSVGVLRVAAQDRAEAAAIWAAAADTMDRALAGVDLFDLALVALVRGGLAVSEVRAGYFGWRRGAVRQPGSTGSAWQQRLRTASRGGDGFFSAMAVRPLSRRATAVGLRHDWSPNVLTLVSLAVGLLTAGLIWSGQHWAWVVAAFTLQLALVVDCMDGEIARFTRRFSTLGAWLDGVGDRIKEYAVFAALAAVASRQGDDSGWLLAIIAMTVVTARHLEDQSFNDQLAPTKISRPVLLDLAQRDEGTGAPTTMVRPSRWAAVRFWLKKIVHVPIAERYLILSVSLLTFRPVWVLVATIVFSGLALIWTQGGRTVMAILRPQTLPAPDPNRGPDSLRDQLDLGPLARAAGRRLRLPFVPGLLAAMLAWLVVVAAICLGWFWIALVGAVVGAACCGMACSPPVNSRWAWQALPLVWFVEAAVVAALLCQAPVGGWVFGYLAVIAYRRYDLIYSIKLAGASPSRRTTLLGGGFDGRIVALTLLLTLSQLLGIDPDRSVPIALGVGGGYCALVYLAESVRQWRPKPSVSGKRT
jgi:hypothetical protein